MLNNTEVQALISAIGAGFGEEFDLEKIRYHKLFYWQMLMLTEAT